RVESVSATLLVDTGATRTRLVPHSAAAEALRGRSVEQGETRGVGGATERDRRAPAVVVSRGGATTTGDVTIGSAMNTCAPDGLLGMDALRRCVIVLSRAVSLRCGS